LRKLEEEKMKEEAQVKKKRERKENEQRETEEKKLKAIDLKTKKKAKEDKLKEEKKKQLDEYKERKKLLTPSNTNNVSKTPSSASGKRFESSGIKQDKKENSNQFFKNFLSSYSTPDKTKKNILGLYYFYLNLFFN
jgi:hypothetical protein